MEYIVFFLAGGALTGLPLIIWFYGNLALIKTKKKSLEEKDARLKKDADYLLKLSTELGEKTKQLETRKVNYDELFKENSDLKKDLFNLAVQIKKTERDHAAISQRQEEINKMANQLAEHYLDDTVAWIGEKITPNNFAGCKQKLLKVVEDCKNIGVEVPKPKEDALIDNLKKEFEQAVRDEFHRQEQVRIKAQIREEEKLARDLEKQKQDTEREKTAKEREKASIQEALDQALKAAKDEHSVEVEYWKKKLTETEEKLKEVEEKERAISQAQLTKSGYVYVLSNIGSFGEGVFKVGMTRRLEPMDRVRELGDASVPFPFDVHMMVSCNNAPALENALHKELHKLRMNKVNFRKEYFRVDLESIRKIVESNHGEVDYVAEPAALQFHESMNMSQEDYDFIEQTAESIMGQDDSPFVDD